MSLAWTAPSVWWNAMSSTARTPYPVLAWSRSFLSSGRGFVFCLGNGRLSRGRLAADLAAPVFTEEADATAIRTQMPVLIIFIFIFIVGVGVCVGVGVGVIVGVCVGVAVVVLVILVGDDVATRPRD